MPKEIPKRPAHWLCFHLISYYVVRRGQRWPNPTFFGRTKGFMRCPSCNIRMDRYQEEQTHKCGECGREKDTTTSILICSKCNYIVDNASGSV